MAKNGSYTKMKLTCSLAILAETTTFVFAHFCQLNSHFSLIVYWNKKFDKTQHSCFSVSFILGFKGPLELCKCCLKFLKQIIRMMLLPLQTATKESTQSISSRVVIIIIEYSSCCSWTSKLSMVFRIVTSQIKFLCAPSVHKDDQLQ